MGQNTSSANGSAFPTPRLNPDAPAIQKLRLQIGPYHVRPVPTGIFGLDGGAMFGTVPKVLWERTNPADAQNRIPMEARALLLDGAKTNGKRILIDCGIGGDFIAKYGEKLGAKFSEMYAIQGEGDSEGPAIERNLNAMGVSADSVTDVILTHLHFDHCGGATRFRLGKLGPTFHKARYYVQKANLETARQPNLREKASYYGPNFEPLIDAGVLEILDGAKSDLLPGVSVELTHGHTVGQQTVRVSDDSSSLVYCADLIPTSTHVRLPWVMGYDLNPLQLIEEKRQLLTPAANKSWYLFFEHDPYIDAAKVIEFKGDFALQDRFLLEA